MTNNTNSSERPKRKYNRRKPVAYVSPEKLYKPVMVDVSWLLPIAAYYEAVGGLEKLPPRVANAIDSLMWYLPKKRF